MASKLIERCFEDFKAANLQCDRSLLTRFVAALLAKRFVILTGLAGSGKTKVAQSFARWISQFTVNNIDPFVPGANIQSDRIQYFVRDSDRLSVEFWNDEDVERAVQVSLPRGLIRDWMATIKERNFTTDNTAREIRKAVEETSKYSPQLSSFETHLKAAAFALLAAPEKSSRDRAYEIVAVGADWTSSEHILSYPDGLDKSRYVRTRTLDLILRAIRNPQTPHFLILDEMNLSHVERYFADFLSALESGEPSHLHSDKDSNGLSAVRDQVPGEIRIPSNLFVIGTVNVDETTYMFSPKVLDRANVLEFRVSTGQIREFLRNATSINFAQLDARGADFAKDFGQSAGQLLDADEVAQFESELALFFSALQSANAEFGFGVAAESNRFLRQFKQLSRQDWKFTTAMDALVLQKLLPKLHGSRNTLEPVLWTLATLCFVKRNWQKDAATGEFPHSKSLSADLAKACRMEDDSLDPLSAHPDGSPRFPTLSAEYPLSFDKIVRMLSRLRANGFTSFAEA